MTQSATARPSSLLGYAAIVWGLVGVLLLLLRAIVGLTPIAYAAVTGGELSVLQWVLLGAWVIFMAYAEGYKGFQLRFSPFVGARALELKARPTWVRAILAPAFCLGLFDATRRRMIVSWSVLLGVTALVVLVRLLDQPWRGIVDAGVVVGLSWGTLSLLGSVGAALVTGRPAADAELPGSPRHAPTT